MGEQARRRVGEDFVHRSIHQAIEWHRTMRRRAKVRACIETIYARPTPKSEPSRPKLTLTPKVRALALTYTHRKRNRTRKPNAERDAFRAEAAKLRESKLTRIVNIQDNRCYLCPEPFIWPDLATIDHVVPRDPKGGGGKNAGNVLAAHKACNNRKANRAPYACELLFLEAVNEQLREEPVSDPDLIAPSAPVGARRASEEFEVGTAD